MIITVVIASTFLAASAPALTEPHLLSSAQTPADAVVRQLRELPTPLPGIGPSDGRIPPIELRRRELYSQLRQLGDDALPALARELSNPDVQMRRNVALVLNVLGGGWFDSSQPKMNIRACLPALVTALNDGDANVRGWSAQAIGEIGPEAAEAVPALVTLLKKEDEGSRNSAAIALRGIGTAAKRRTTCIARGAFRSKRKCARVCRTGH